MKKFNLNYRNFQGGYCCEILFATCETDARFIAREFYRSHFGICALALFDTDGKYIEL